MRQGAFGLHHSIGQPVCANAQATEAVSDILQQSFWLEDNSVVGEHADGCLDDHQL